jgi:tRNA(adenine34) deaminase
MRAAIDQARLALALDEVPVGCAIYHPPTDRILATAHNRRESDKDPTAHAEMLALRQAAAELGHWRLFECTLAVTLEPCPMCAGGLVNSRIRRLVYGCPDPKAGAVRTLFQLCDDPRLNHRVEIVPGILTDECAQLLKDFFKSQRDLGKK